MKISLVGDFSFPDESRKVMAHYLAKELSKNNDIIKQNLQEIFTMKFWENIRLFEPDIIYYIPGASSFSLLLTKIMRLNTKNAKTIILSSLPTFDNYTHGIYYSLSSLGKKFIPFIKTDLILVQSEYNKKLFMELGCNVKFQVSSGVDIEKFCPVSKEKKNELRKIYNIPLEKFVILHVGTVRKWRNVELLKEIQGQLNTQIVIIGRISMKYEKNILEDLQESGIIIINEYLPKIEDMYALSDCYIFPTIDHTGCIDIPLSVLEAMSTNLPIITTNFGGLPIIFKEGNGLIFANPYIFSRKVKLLKNNNSIIRTRENVIEYSWSNIAKNLENTCKELLSI